MASDRTVQPAMPTTEGILQMQQLLVMIAGIRGERAGLEIFVRQCDIICGLAKRLQLDELFTKVVRYQLVCHFNRNIQASIGIDFIANWQRARADLKKGFGGGDQRTQEALLSALQMN